MRAFYHGNSQVETILGQMLLCYQKTAKIAKKLCQW